MPAPEPPPTTPDATSPDATSQSANSPNAHGRGLLGLGTLPGATLLFIATWVIHTGDHGRRGIAASAESVTWIGTFAALLAAVSITLVFARHPIAPTVAAIAFPSIAIGVSAVHLLPDWGPLSDPILVESTSDAWTVLAVFPEIIAAAWLGWLAFTTVRRHDYALEIDASQWSPIGRADASDRDAAPA